MAGSENHTTHTLRQPDVAQNVAMRFAAILAVVSILSCRTMQPRETGFLDRSLQKNGTTYRYSVYVPAEFESGHAWPVILFLHGSGERGTDGLRGTQIGVAAAIRHDRERVPAIVVFPQVPPDQRWLGEPADVAIEALERAIVEFHGDRDRVYLAGLSMGGYGSYHLALAHPRTFAAMVVVCGGLFPHPTTTAVQQSPLTKGAADPYAFTAHALRSMPMWLFHGDADPVIPVSESRTMVAALRAEGSEAKYTELAGVGHNAWDAAFSSPELWRWLFAQHR